MGLVAVAARVVGNRRAAQRAVDERHGDTAEPVVLSLPNCFAFGTTTSTTPTITAVLPASGANEGNTRVTIIGAGFDAAGGVQVFFGGVEATIVSVSFNQIVVLTPAAFGSGRDNLNQTVDVRVRNIRSGLETTLEDGYRYTQPLQLISITNNEQRLDQPFIPVTIFGPGYQTPVFALGSFFSGLEPFQSSL